MLAIMSAIVMLEAVGWLAFLVYTIGHNHRHGVDRLIRNLAAAGIIVVCIWLATSLSTHMDIDKSIIFAYAGLHVLWPVERWWTLWTEQRGSRD